MRPTPSPALPPVALVATGGTISMRTDPKSGVAVPALSAADLVRQTPDLARLADLKIVDFARIPGWHMDPHQMLALANTLVAALAAPEVVGAVVTHGTDTLEETAFFLDRVLPPEKPVAITGSMRSSSEPGWDGPANLAAAVCVAASGAARGLGTVVVMNGEIHAAYDATKMHTSNTGAFASLNTGPLGVVDGEQVQVFRRPIRHPVWPRGPLEARVGQVTLPAGASGLFIEAALNVGAAGLVIEGLGRGNVPPRALPAIRRACAAGMHVVIASRCPGGRVRDVYGDTGGGREIADLGVMSAGWLSAPKARLALMLLLGRAYPPEVVREQFLAIAEYPVGA